MHDDHDWDGDLVVVSDTGPLIVVPLWVIDRLRDVPAALTLWLIMASHVDQPGPTDDTLAREAGFPVADLAGHVATLTDRGVLTPEWELLYVDRGPMSPQLELLEDREAVGGQLTLGDVAGGG